MKGLQKSLVFLCIFQQTCVFYLLRYTTSDIVHENNDFVRSAWDFLHTTTGDSSWLVNHVQTGKFLGSGSISTIFEAQVNATQAKGRQWVLRVTNHCESQRALEFAQNQIHALQRLSPHPNIPRLLYAAENISNPFHHQLQLPHELESTDREDLLNCPRMSVSIEERIHSTRKVTVLVNTTTKKKSRYNIPSKRIRCFWRQVFETLAYAHGKGVMLRDPLKRNIWIQKGRVKFFDWNHGRIYDPTGPPMRIYDGILNGGPPENKNRSAVYVNAHAYDAWVVGSWILDMWKETTTEDARIVLSEQDKLLLKDLSKSLHVKDPARRPTLRMQLDTHPYFAVEKNDTCMDPW